MAMIPNIFTTVMAPPIIDPNSTKCCVKCRGGQEVFWGGIWGLAFCAIMYSIPVVGPMMFLDPIVRWIVLALEAAVVIGGGISIGVVFYNMGKPKQNITPYRSPYDISKPDEIEFDSNGAVICVRTTTCQNKPSAPDDLPL